MALLYGVIVNSPNAMGNVGEWPTGALIAYACKPPHLAWSHYKSMLEAQ